MNQLRNGNGDSPSPKKDHSRFSRSGHLLDEEVDGDHQGNFAQKPAHDGLPDSRNLDDLYPLHREGRGEDEQGGHRAVSADPYDYGWERDEPADEQATGSHFVQPEADEPAATTVDPFADLFAGAVTAPGSPYADEDEYAFDPDSYAAANGNSAADRDEPSAMDVLFGRSDWRSSSKGNNDRTSPQWDPATPPATTPVNETEPRVVPPAQPFDSVEPDMETFSTPAVDLPTDDNQRVYMDPRFQVASQKMQQADWRGALEQLRALRMAYPNAGVLRPLLNEAELRTSIETTWSDKIQGRRMTVSFQHLLRKILPVLLVLALFWIGILFYRAYVMPSRQANSLVRQQQMAVSEAVVALQQGDYPGAVALFDQVLAQSPNDATARKGRSEAMRQITLDAEYFMATKTLEAGNPWRALLFFEEIQAKAPGYRDVQAQIDDLQSVTSAGRLFSTAEQAFRREQWLLAIQKYEALRQINSTFREDVVGPNLLVSYLRGGQLLLSRWPETGDELKQAEAYIRNVLAGSTEQPTARKEIALLESYQKAVHLLNVNNQNEAIVLLRNVHAERPDYLGGYLAQQMYDTLLAMGDRAMKAKDYRYAAELYQEAAALDVQDTSQAQARLKQADLGLQPDPTPTPQPVYRAPAAAVAPPPPPAPPVNSYSGWIAFHTNRNGGDDIFLMRADGSEQQSAPQEIREQMGEFYGRQQRSPDGQRHLSVQQPANRDDVNLYIDGAELTNYGRDEYDPVWSPNGATIAFVSNHTDNDEIWTIGVDGSNPRRLTWNEWQWDKFPTWSPDGTQIVFYSNRSGNKQIWLMNADGANQRNLSNNNFDDWNPVWIR